MGFEHSEVGQTVYIVPVAFELAFKGDEVVPGTGTEMACDLAITHALKVIKDGRIPVILTTATRAGLKYHRVLMGQVMADYIRSKAPNLKVIFHEAPEFTTAGEAVAVFDYLWEYDGIRPQVIFCVKNWHAPRVRRIARIASKSECCPASISVVTHPLHCSFKTRLREILGWVVAYQSVMRAHVKLRTMNRSEL